MFSSNTTPPPLIPFLNIFRCCNGPSLHFQNSVPFYKTGEQATPLRLRHSPPPSKVSCAPPPKNHPASLLTSHNCIDSSLYHSESDVFSPLCRYMSLVIAKAAVANSVVSPSVRPFSFFPCSSSRRILIQRATSTELSVARLPLQLLILACNLFAIILLSPGFFFLTVAGVFFLDIFINLLRPPFYLVRWFPGV